MRMSVCQLKLQPVSLLKRWLRYRFFPVDLVNFSNRISPRDCFELQEEPTNNLNFWETPKERSNILIFVNGLSQNTANFTAQKMKFSIRFSSVNVIQSAGNCRFGHIYWRNPWWQTSFFLHAVGGFYNICNPWKARVTII